MNNAIENNGGQFANGQASCDLREHSDAMEQFPAPIGKLLGLKLLQAENGMAVVEFVADERHANPMGTLTGGVSAPSLTRPWASRTPPRSRQMRVSRLWT